MGDKRKNYRGAFSDGDSPEHSDTNIFKEEGSHNIAIFKRITDSSFANNNKVSDFKPENALDFDEQIVGEVTNRFYKTRISKIKFLSRPKDAVQAKTLLTDINQKAKSDTLSGKAVKPSLIEVCTTSDSASLEAITTKSLENIPRSSSTGSETLGSETSLNQLFDASESKTLIHGENKSSFGRFDEEVAGSIGLPNFSVCRKKSSLECQTEAKDQSESPGIQNQSYLVKNPEEVCLSNIQDGASLEVPEELSLPTERKETPFVLKQQAEDVESQAGDYESKSEEATSALEFQKEECSPDVQTEEGIAGNPSLLVPTEEYVSAVLNEQGLSDPSTKRRLPEKQIKDDLSDFLTEISDMQKNQLQFYAEIPGSHRDTFEAKAAEDLSEIPCHTETEIQKFSAYIHTESQKVENDLPENFTQEDILANRNEISTEAEDTLAEQNEESLPKSEEIQGPADLTCSAITKRDQCVLLNYVCQSDVSVRGQDFEKRMGNICSEVHTTEIDTTVTEQLEAESEIPKVQIVPSQAEDDETEVSQLTAQIKKYFSEVRSELAQVERDFSGLLIEESATGIDLGSHMGKFSLQVHTPEIGKTETEPLDVKSGIPKVQAVASEVKAEEVKTEGSQLAAEIQKYYSRLRSELTKVQCDLPELLIEEIASGTDLANQTGRVFSEGRRTEIDKAKTEALEDESEILKVQTVSSEAEEEKTEVSQLTAEVKKYCSDIRSEMAKVHLDCTEFLMKESASGTETGDPEIHTEIIKGEFPEAQTQEHLSEVRNEVSKTEMELSKVQTELLLSGVMFLEKEFPARLTINERSYDDPNQTCPKLQTYSSDKTSSDRDLAEGSSQMKTAKNFSDNRQLQKECTDKKLNKMHQITENQLHSLGAVSDSTVPIPPSTSREAVCTDVETKLLSHETLQNYFTSLSGQETVLERPAIPCEASGGISAGAAFSHPDDSEKITLAYFAGDKISTFTPFAYVLNADNIKKKCSYCFQTLKLRKNECGGCSHVYYCNKDCKKKHFHVHKRECQYLRAIDSSEMPQELVRLVAHAMWRLEEPSSHDIFCIVGTKKYYYRDLIICPVYASFNSPDPGANDTLTELIELHHRFCSFVKDSSISLVDFRTLLGKVYAHTAIITDEFGDIGVGMYFGMAAIQYSCFPTANLSFIGTTAQMVAAYDLEDEDPHEATIRMSYFMAPREVRQAQIKRVTGEVCHCVSCVDDDFENLLNEVTEEEPVSAVDILVQVINDREQHTYEYDEKDLEFASTALKVINSVAGTYHYIRGKMLNLAAVSAMKLQQYREAIGFCNELLPVQQFAYGLHNPQILKMQYNLSQLHSKVGNSEKARAHFAECLQIAHIIYTAEHPVFKRLRFEFIKKDECNSKEAINEEDNFMYE